MFNTLSPLPFGERIKVRGFALTLALSQRERGETYGRR